MNRISEDEYLGKGVCPISRKPLPGGRAGHLPSAKLLDAAKVVREDGTFLEPAALRALMSQAGIETDRPTILYSNGGVARTQPSSRSAGSGSLCGTTSLASTSGRRTRHFLS